MVLILSILLFRHKHLVFKNGFWGPLGKDAVFSVPAPLIISQWGIFLQVKLGTPPL